MGWRDAWVDPWVTSRLDESPIYGILWNRGSSSTSLQRIDENGDTITLATSNFDNHPLWGEMKRCTINAAGDSISYGSDAKGTGLTLTNDYCMVEIPGCYAGSYREGDYQGLLFGTRPFSSQYVASEWHPTFWRRNRTGKKAPKMYLGAYESSASGGTTTANGTTNCIKATNWTGLKLTSKSGAKCLTGDTGTGTISQFEAAANGIGTNWGITSFWTRALIQGLYYVEYANMNSQSALAPGRTNASNTSALDTGAGNALMAANGTGGGTDTQAVCYRGIENPWGNIWEFVIGFNTVDAEYQVMKRDGTGALAIPLASGNYEATSGITPLNGTTNVSGTDAGDYCHGPVKDVLFTDPLKLAFIPSNLTGSDTTYLADTFYSHRSGISQTSILLAGGTRNAAGKAGVGCLYAYHAASYVGSSLGARLEAIF